MVEISLSGVSGGGRKRTMARIEALAAVERRQLQRLPDAYSGAPALDPGYPYRLI